MNTDILGRDKLILENILYYFNLNQINTPLEGISIGHTNSDILIERTNKEYNGYINFRNNNITSTLMEKLGKYVNEPKVKIKATISTSPE